jgi:hypothetical protein
MSTRQPRPAALGLALLVALASMLAAAHAQAPASGPFAPFKVSEAAVRTEILKSVSQGGEVSAGLVAMILEGYDRVPAPLRAAATTAAFAWAKNYVSSPAFAAAYAQYREEHKPAGRAASTEAIDVDVQKEIAQLVAQLEASKAALGVLDAATRAKVIANIDDQIARFKSPENVRAIRVGIEARRAGEHADNSRSADDFATKWPADPKVFVRKHLERFMSATATIDYSLAQIWIKGPSGRTAGFLSPGLEDISWDTMHAIVAGKDAVDAARAAVSAWLKELP